jgi:tripartite-type tricarboxylate transporter receptor subunit TctC
MVQDGITRRGLIAGGTAAAVVTGAAPAWAQGPSYPSRSIRVIVPFAAGGPSDLIARIIAEALYPKLGRTLVIENHPGGGANTGIGLAAHAEPDGYTLLITTSAIAINPSLYKRIPFDPVKDFAPLCDLAVSPQMLSVMPGFADTLADFIAKAKAAPGELNYSSPGVGTQAQLTVELLKLRAGIDVVHVPFSGGPPAVQALLSGTTQLVTNAVPTSQKLVEAGRIHALAVSGKSRYFALPNVPTLIESGFPGFVTDTFVGFFAPARTPKEIVDRLARASQDALKDPNIIARARQAGFEVVAGGPDDLAQRLTREIAFNHDIITKAGIEPR